jgi:hypothetical protein
MLHSVPYTDKYMCLPVGNQIIYVDIINAILKFCLCPEDIYVFTYYGLFRMCMEHASTDTGQGAIIILASCWSRTGEVPLSTIPALPLWACPVDVIWAQIIVPSCDCELHMSPALVPCLCLLLLHTYLE